VWCCYPMIVSLVLHCNVSMSVRRFLFGCLSYRGCGMFCGILRISYIFLVHFSIGFSIIMVFRIDISFKIQYWNQFQIPYTLDSRQITVIFQHASLRDSYRQIKEMWTKLSDEILLPLFIFEFIAREKERSKMFFHWIIVGSQNDIYLNSISIRVIIIH
jgi:hypothetical protein